MRSAWVALGLVLGVAIHQAHAGLDATPDLSGYATKDAVASAIAGAATPMRVDAIPTTPPGAGRCRFSLVPSNLVQSGGVTGTVGKCSRIVQCGTSADYVVQIFDIGDGC